MTSEQSVEQICNRIAESKYLGQIQGIAAIIINPNGEIEIQLGFDVQHAYAMIAGFEIMKQNLLNDIVGNAAGPPEERDI